MIQVHTLSARVWLRIVIWFFIYSALALMLPAVQDANLSGINTNGTGEPNGSSAPKRALLNFSHLTGSDGVSGSQLEKAILRIWINGKKSSETDTTNLEVYRNLAN